MKFSIVTPSYNQGAFIERTLESVARQRGVQIEHFVADGGSTDNTVEILRRYDGSICWVSESDRGQAHAVNKGIQQTNGEIIGWLNSDDIYYPDAITRVADYFAAHDDVDVVYGMADHIDLQDKAFEAYPTQCWDLAKLKETCFICQPALFFRRRVVDRCGLLDESLNYCMDYEYWLRLGSAGVRFAYLEHKLAGSRLYAENKTLGARVGVHREINQMFREKFGRVPDRWLVNYAHAVADRKTGGTRDTRWYAALLLLTSLGAAWRWNGGVSCNMIRGFFSRGGPSAG